MGTKAQVAAVAAPQDAPKAAAAAVEAPTVTGYDDAVAGFIQPSGLGEEGKKYIETLTETLKKLDPSVIVEHLPHRIESFAIINPALKKAFILLFQEDYTASQATMPPTEYMPEIVLRSFKTRHSDVACLQYIVVSAADYGRAVKMAVHIVNAFRSVTPGIAITGSTFRQMRLVPCTDLKQVTNFIDKYSPHEVPDRADWGVMLNRVINNERNEAYTNIREPELHPIVAATGYTKFLQIGDGLNVRFLPIVVITNVTSTVPSTDILPLILPVVAGTVIQNKLWLRPYTSWSDNKPNLGRLLVDPVKKTLKLFHNIDEQNAELAGKMIEVPYLALDCAEGRARIPYLEKLVMTDTSTGTNQNTYIPELVSRFFGPVEAANFLATCPVSTICTFLNYEGVYTTGGKKLDTRNADYLNTVTATKDYQRSHRMLAQCMAPAQHLIDVTEVYGEDAVVPLYRVHTLVFNSALINILANAVSRIVNYQADISVNQNYDFGSFLQQFNTAIGGANAIYGAGYGAFNAAAGASLYL